jgi:hypothetical protein
MAMKPLLVIMFVVLGMAAGASAAEEVTYTGELLGGRVAVGGETTGWALRYRTPEGLKTIELQLTAEQKQRFKPGSQVKVTGTIVEREYVERGKVPVLIVRAIEAA